MLTPEIARPAGIPPAARVFILQEASMAASPQSRARIAFVLVLLVLGAAGAIGYHVARGQNAYYEIRSRDSVSGLIVGAPVEFHGVEVGKVDEVELLDPRNVRVVVAVRRGVPVTSATVATITGRGLATRGFTGYVYVSLEDRSDRGEPLVAAAGDRHPAIATAPSQTVSLDTSINQLNDNVQAAVTLLRTTLDAQTVASLKRSVAQLDEVTRTLAANNARMQAIFVNAEKTTAQLPPLLESGTQTFHAMRADLLPQAGSTLAQMNATIAQTQETLQVLRTQVLPDARQTVKRLDELSASLADLAERIRRNPSVLLWGERSRTEPGAAR
jgi:phospholipid/cholesterol/gamma-HCH transport system substrate-binding protein